MNYAFHAARLLLGIVYLVFGANGFVTFIPVPEQPPAAAQFIADLIATGYMLYFWKSIEVISAILFLVNRYTLFAALIALPVSANILAFHLFLDPDSLLIGLAVFALNAIILAGHRDALRVLMKQ